MRRCADRPSGHPFEGTTFATVRAAVPHLPAAADDQQTTIDEHSEIRFYFVDCRLVLPKSADCQSPVLSHAPPQGAIYGHGCKQLFVAAKARNTKDHSNVILSAF